MPSLESQIKTAADNAQNRFGKDVITDRYEFRGDITLTVARHAVADVVRWLRDSAGFDMMVNLCSVDNMGESPRFEVNYTLTQAETGVNLSLKTKVDDGEEVPSVTEIFQSANWHEREVWDLMGIKFSGHPDLRRILMWEGYPYFPLRKDFPVQGVPTELPGVAFTEAAPTQGAPFATEQGRCPAPAANPGPINSSPFSSPARRGPSHDPTPPHPARMYHQPAQRLPGRQPGRAGMEGPVI